MGDAPLNPEDGAKFHARIDAVGQGQFRAMYVVRLDNIEESPEYRMCKTHAEAQRWLHQSAGRREFKTILWDEKI
jgi:predicted molibdopterin-dependent oxidoreductase YjgC